MSHMSSGFYRDRLGFDPNKESSAPASATASSAMSASSMTRRTVTSTSYSSSSLNRQEASRNVQSSSSSAGHYAVSSHVSNGNLVVDNGGGVIQTQSGNHYEENLGKFKGRAHSFFICIIFYYIIIDIFT